MNPPLPGQEKNSGLFFFSENQSLWSLLGSLNQMPLQLEMNDYMTSAFTHAGPAVIPGAWLLLGHPLNNPGLYNTCWRRAATRNGFNWKARDCLCEHASHLGIISPLPLSPDAGSLCTAADHHTEFIFIAWMLVSRPHQLQPFVLPLDECEMKR